MGFTMSNLGALGSLFDKSGRASVAMRMNTAYDTGTSKAAMNFAVGTVVGIPVLAYHSFVQASDDVSRDHGDENFLARALAIAASTPKNFLVTLYRTPGEVIVNTPRDLRNARSHEEIADAFFARAGVAITPFFLAEGATSLLSSARGLFAGKLGFRPMGQGLAYATNVSSTAFSTTAVATALGKALGTTSFAVLIDDDWYPGSAFSLDALLDSIDMIESNIFPPDKSYIELLDVDELFALREEYQTMAHRITKQRERVARNADNISGAKDPDLPNDLMSRLDTAEQLLNESIVLVENKLVEAKALEPRYRMVEPSEIGRRDPLELNFDEPSFGDPLDPGKPFEDPTEYSVPPLERHRL